MALRFIARHNFIARLVMYGVVGLQPMALRLIARHSFNARYVWCSGGYNLWHCVLLLATVLMLDK